MNTYKEFVTFYKGAKDTMVFDTLPIETTDRKFNAKLCDYDFAFEVLRSLTGEVLTVIDAVIPQGQQNKSTKDVIRNAFSEKMEFLCDMLIDQKACQETIDELGDDLEEVDIVSMEDIIGN